MNIDYYENWNVFVSNIEKVPEQLDGEKLITMVFKLSRTSEERELLGKEAAAGSEDSLKSLLNSYVPMIVATMKRYERRGGYSRDVLLTCVEKLRKEIANSLYVDNLDYTISHYISRMVRIEVVHQLAQRDSLKGTFD